MYSASWCSKTGWNMRNVHNVFDHPNEINDRRLLIDKKRFRSGSEIL